MPQRKAVLSVGAGSGSLGWLMGMCLFFEVLRAGKRAVDLCVATRLSAGRTGGRTAGGNIAECIIQ